jgi:hypothetical protein
MDGEVPQAKNFHFKQRAKSGLWGTQAAQSDKFLRRRNFFLTEETISPVASSIEARPLAG